MWCMCGSSSSSSRYTNSSSPPLPLLPLSHAILSLLFSALLFWFGSCNKRLEVSLKLLLLLLLLQDENEHELSGLIERSKLERERERKREKSLPQYTNKQAKSSSARDFSVLLLLPFSSSSSSFWGVLAGMAVAVSGAFV